MQINGLVLGKYRIERLINNGSFASVFRAKEELTNRIVAIKTLPRSIYPAGRMRYLLTELSAMGMNWGHQNIVSIHTVEPGDKQYVAYIVMEYVDGPSLRQLMSVKRLAPNLAINIALDICRGLMAAHEHNIIHRDIKPQNLLMTSNQTAKISDFGVARILEATNDYAGTLTGTRKYMAPEQYGGSYDYRVDLYPVGLIIYEMFMGRFPFRGKNLDEIQMKKQCGEIDFGDELSDDLRTLVRKALHRDVNARYQTAVELYDDLDRIRKKWYADAVGEIARSYSDAVIPPATLSRCREDFQLSTEAAEKIELELRAEQTMEVERQTRLRLETKVDAHYNQAIQCVRSNQLQQALREMQQAHRLYLDNRQATEKAEDIYRALSDALVPPSPPSTSKDVIAVVDQLPAKELSDFKMEFCNRFGLNESSESSSLSTSGGSTTDGETHANSYPPTFDLQDPPAESVLRKLHEVVHKPHEIIAASIRQAAEEYAQRRKSRHSRAKYKKLGEHYRKSAVNFIQSKNWTLAADCYARSGLAYTAAGRYNKAKQCAREAGLYYARLAAPLERRQDWLKAAKLYELSAEQYVYTGLEEVADESRRPATICYFNVAENARAEGNLNMAYEYCIKILEIAKKMQRPSKAATGARKLMREIETLFTMSQEDRFAQASYPQYDRGYFSAIKAN